MAEHGIDDSSLRSYIASEDTVKETRQTVAASIEGCTISDVKRLGNAQGYGSAGKDFREQFNLVRLPFPFHGIGDELWQLVRAQWQTVDEQKRKVCENRNRPPLTLHSILNQIWERQQLLQISRSANDRCGHALRGWINDAVVLWSHGADIGADLTLLSHELARDSGLLVKMEKLSMTTAEYKDWAQAKWGALDFSPLSPLELDALKGTPRIVDLVP